MARGAGFRVEVKGLREAQQAFRRAGATVEDLREVNRDIARIVEREALQRVPRRSGDLAGSHKVTATARSAAVTAGPGLRYAGVIHHGWPTRGLGRGMTARQTRGQFGGLFSQRTTNRVVRRRNRVRGGPIRPNPWLYDALDDRRRQVIDKYDKAIEKIARRLQRDLDT